MQRQQLPMEHDDVNTCNSGERFALRREEGEHNRETFVGWGWVGLGFFCLFFKLIPLGPSYMVNTWVFVTISSRF